MFTSAPIGAAGWIAWVISIIVSLRIAFEKATKVGKSVLGVDVVRRKSNGARIVEITVLPLAGKNGVAGLKYCDANPETTKDSLRVDPNVDPRKISRRSTFERRYLRQCWSYRRV